MEFQWHKDVTEYRTFKLCKWIARNLTVNWNTKILTFLSITFDCKITRSIVAEDYQLYTGYRKFPRIKTEDLKI